MHKCKYSFTAQNWNILSYMYSCHSYLTCKLNLFHISLYCHSLALPHFSTQSHKQHDLKGKGYWTYILNIHCVLISLQIVPEIFYILIRIFWTDFKKSSSFMKICQLGAELFQMDRPIDNTKLTVAFRNFADAPQKVLHSFDSHWI